MHFKSSRTIGFMGTGNMTQAIVQALVETGTVPANQIFATNRTEGKLKKTAEAFGIQALQSNEELIEKSDVVILAMKPQDLPSALEPVASNFQAKKIVISLAAGISLSKLRKMLGPEVTLVRVMPNTAAKIRQSVIGYCSSSTSPEIDSFMEGLFSPLGIVVKTEEGEAFEALSVSSACGIGFVLELMQYWQEWLEEHGFESPAARAMTVKTFLGASMVADNEEAVPLHDLQSRVTSKKGTTAAGLDSMRELEIERALRYSFEKAVLRDRELGK